MLTSTSHCVALLEVPLAFNRRMTFNARSFADLMLTSIQIAFADERRAWKTTYRCRIGYLHEASAPSTGAKDDGS
jgi:hypothetical protein